MIRNSYIVKVKCGGMKEYNYTVISLNVKGINIYPSSNEGMSKVLLQVIAVSTDP